MTTALTTSNHALSVFVDESAEKLLPMVAEAIGIKAADIAAPHVQGTIIKAVSWMHQFGAIPGIHFDTMSAWSSKEKRREYPLVPKLGWSLHNLEQYNKENPSVHYRVVYRKATPEEVREQYDLLTTKFNKYIYDERDQGYFAALYNEKGRDSLIDILRMEKDMGIEILSWYFGCHRYRVEKKGKDNGVYYTEDMRGNTETAEQAAKRRAGKKAINATCTLKPIVADTASRMAYAQSSMEGEYRERRRVDPRDSAPPIVVNGSTVDDDGLFIVDEEPPPDDRWGRADKADAAAYDSDAEWESIPDKDASQAGAAQPTGYTHLRSHLTGKAKQFVDWAAELNMDPKDGACTEAQYRFLFSLFRDLAGKGREEAAMEVVFGAKVAVDDRPGFKITKQLLDILPATRGKGEKKTENENHRADICGIIEVIGQMVKEA